MLNQEYLQKYWNRVLQTWHLKCTKEKKQNDTYYGGPVATLSARVAFYEKTLNSHGCHIVLTPTRLTGVDDIY